MCFVFIVERKLHKTNSKYRLFLIVHYIYVCIITKSCYLFSKYYLYLIFIFSNFTALQSPTGGTSGLCFKKLNITTSSYRIIINRLDRKVNLCLIYCQEFILSHVNNAVLVASVSICLQVTVNYRPVRLPFSRHSLYVEDTGSMYLIHTPGGVSIQWYHSTGIMVLQYITTYNSSVPTRGLCGESPHTHSPTHTHP